MPHTADRAGTAADRALRGASAKTFRPDIEGLRAVAVMAVVLFHADLPGLGGGFVGVDIFFVISGFLITGLLWREAGASGSVRLRNFYGARARRLLPASATVGVVTMVASAFLLPPLQVRSVSIDGITSALYVSNYRFITSGVKYFGKQGVLSPSPFQHYWSLGVEEQFYLVWPILIIGTAWLIRRARKLSDKSEAFTSVRPYLIVLTLVAVVSFALSMLFTYLLPPIAFFSLPTRAWQLAAGGLVALTAVAWRRLSARSAAMVGWTGLALIAIACTCLTGATPFPGTAALLPTLGAVLVIGAGCAHPDSGCGRLLGLAPMGAIGRLSYSLYLWHWPVLVLLPAWVGHPVGLPIKLVAVAVCIVLSVLTLRFIENPLRFAPSIRDSARASLGLGAGVTAVAVAVGVAALLWVPVPEGHGPEAGQKVIDVEPVPPGASIAEYDAAVQDIFGQVQAIVAESADREVVPSNLRPSISAAGGEQFGMLDHGCLRILPFDSELPECAVGDLDSTTTVALIGDSRAAMLNPAFQQAAEQRHWRLEKMSKAACPIVDLPLTSQLNDWAEEIQRCAQWRTRVVKRLLKERPQLVVISSSRAYDANGAHVLTPGLKMFDEAWINGLTDLVRQLRDVGSRVLVLSQSPEPPPVPLCLSGHLDHATACSAKPPSQHGIDVESAAVSAAGGQFVDTSALFCAGEHCPVIVGDMMVYFDAGHLTREYSRFLTPAMGALVDRALAGG